MTSDDRARLDSGVKHSTPRARLDALTSLRFFAAAFVVLHHIVGPDNRFLVDLGYLGVSFFFVLSGLVLTWARSAEMGAGQFYWNRFSRLYPLHLATLLVALVSPIRPQVDNVSTFVQNLFVLQAWSPSAAHSFNWVSWSISCEAFFYLCFPLALLYAKRLSPLLLASVAGCLWVGQVLVGCGLYLVVDEPYFFTYDFPPFRILEFLIGVALGVVLTRDRALGARCSLWAGIFAVGGTGAVLFAQVLDFEVPRFAATFCVIPMIVVVLYLAVTREMSDRWRVLQNPALVRLGEWSFALYMTHVLVLRFLAGFRDSPQSMDTVGYFPVWTALPILVLCIGVAALAHQMIERPMERKLRHAMTARWRGPMSRPR